MCTSCFRENAAVPKKIESAQFTIYWVLLQITVIAHNGGLHVQCMSANYSQENLQRYEI